jgi:hypothetical protein
MTLTEFLKKWLPDQAPTKRDEFLRDAKSILDPPDSTIWVESVISHRDARPVVGVRMGTFAFQVSPEDARKIGRDFYEVAGGAENDAFLFQKLTGDMNLPPEAVGVLIGELREWRSSRMNQPAASYKPQ